MARASAPPLRRGNGITPIGATAHQSGDTINPFPKQRGSGPEDPRDNLPYCPACRGFPPIPSLCGTGAFTTLGTALPRLGARAGGVGIIRRSERSERSEPPENDKKKTVYHLLDRLPFLDSRIANEAHEVSAVRRCGSGYPLTTSVTAFIVYYKTATKSSPDAKKRPAIAGLIQTASGFQARSPCIPSRCDTPTRGSSVHTA